MTTTISKVRAKQENYLATKKHRGLDSLKRARIMVLVAAFSILGTVIPSSLAGGFFERVIQHVEQLPQAIIEAPEAIIDETKVIVQDTTTAVQNATEEVIKLEHEVENETKVVLQDGSELIVKEVPEALSPVERIAEDVIRELDQAIKQAEKEMEEKVQEVEQEIHQTREDIQDGRYSAAVEDAARLANKIEPGSATAVELVAQSGKDTTREMKEALTEAGHGRGGEAVCHLGGVITSVGDGVSLADPEIGALLIFGGEGLQVTAKQGEHVTLVMHDVEDGNVGKAVEDGIVMPIKGTADKVSQTASDAGQGKLARAAEHIGEGANCLSAGSGTGIIDEAHAGETCVLQAQQAAKSAKDGRLGEAGEKLGQIISAVGTEICQVDDEKGQQVKETGDTVTENSKKAQGISRVLRERKVSDLAKVAISLDSSEESAQEHK